MKKVFALFSTLILFSVTACGPTAEEKAQQEKLKQEKLDSIRTEASKPAIPDSIISE
jgi:predicted small lipoprotein YifL